MKINKYVFIINFYRLRHDLFNEIAKFSSYLFAIHTYLNYLDVVPYIYKSATLGRCSDMHN